MQTKSQDIYIFFHRQIVVMLGLSLLPGLGYILLGWVNNNALPALIWYLLVLVVSMWGYRIYKEFDYDKMSAVDLSVWYKKIVLFNYLIFSLWAVIFVLYANETDSKMHYIAIFTEIGAAVVAATLLYADKKILIPTLLILILPLCIYFAMIGELYGYLLSLFSVILMGVLFYSADSANQLLKKTSHQASHDQLTGIYNRHAFINHLQRKINGLEKNHHFSYLLLIDLDHFKTINDSLGHDVGDLVLQEVSARLQKLTAKENIIARLGGDEFIFLGRDFADKEAALKRALDISHQLLKSIKSTYLIGDHHLYISASIGVSLLTEKRFNANAFVKEADIAMYEVKAQGRDGVILFNDELSNRVAQRLEIEQKLHFALKNKEISLHYQPQLDRGQKTIGCEVLVRWKNQELGMVPPDVFIPIAEQTGFVIELGAYILEEAFKTLKNWQEKGIVMEQFSINISIRQFFHHNFVSEVERLCAKYLDDTLRHTLIFEVTETFLAEDVPRVISVMKVLRNLGIRFSMDDFGTGYSSLNYLQQMPIDELKIDRSFINRLSRHPEDQKMVSIILMMAKSFDLKIVAEGVETQEQYLFLAENNCDIFQGYYYSKPLDKEGFETYYSKNL